MPRRNRSRRSGRGAALDTTKLERMLHAEWQRIQGWKLTKKAGNNKQQPATTGKAPKSKKKAKQPAPKLRVAALECSCTQGAPQGDVLQCDHRTAA